MDCQLHYFNGISSDCVYAKSPMTASGENGILRGRPYGGIAAMWRRCLSKYILSYECDDDCHVVSFKMLLESQMMLLFGCYFPCFSYSESYDNTIGNIICYIDSVANSYPGRERIDNILKINGESVKVENKAKFLGVIFNSQLNWNSHVSYIVDKCKN